MEAMLKNIMAIKAYNEETRGLFRELEQKMKLVETLLLKQNLLEEQVRLLQVKVYSGGSTNGFS